MAELTSMRNIGKEMARKLTAAGIDSPEKLAVLGAKEAFFQMKLLFPQVCLVHLYALEGAIRDLDYNRLPEDVKAELKAFCAFMGSGGAENGPGSAESLY